MAKLPYPIKIPQEGDPAAFQSSYSDSTPPFKNGQDIGVPQSYIGTPVLSNSDLSSESDFSKPVRPCLLSSALGFARSGFSVFPCRERGKEPITRHGCKDATTEEKQIEAWWRSNPNANIGLATGAISGCFVLDVDGHKGEASLRHLEQEYCPLPASVEAITGNGRHVFFRLPPEVTVRNAVKLNGIAGLDIRSNGGYIIAPPSVHLTGKRYEWSVDCADSIADAPDWLLELVQTPTKGKRGRSNDEWLAFIRRDICEGSRNDSIASYAGMLLRSGLRADIVLEMCLCFNAQRCKPPLSEEEIIKIVDSIAGRELARRGE